MKNTGLLVGLGALAGATYLLVSRKSSAAETPVPIPGGNGLGAPLHLRFLPGKFVEIPETGEIARIAEKRGDDLVLEQPHTGLKLPVLYRWVQVRPIDIAEYQGASVGEKVAFESYPYAPGVRALKFGTLGLPADPNAARMAHFTVTGTDGAVDLLGVGQPVWRVTY